MADSYKGLEDLAGEPLTQGQTDTFARLLADPDSVRLAPVAPAQTLDLPREVRVNGGLIILGRSATTGHFVYTSLGNDFQRGGIRTDTTRMPLALDPCDGHELFDDTCNTKPDTISEIDYFGTKRYVVRLNFCTDRPKLWDAATNPRSFSGYFHVVVFSQQPANIAQVRAQVERMYLDSTGVRSLKEAVEQIHAQAQNAVLGRPGDISKLRTLLEKLMDM